MAKKTQKLSKQVKSVQAEVVDDSTSILSPPEDTILQELDQQVDSLEKEELSSSREVAPLDPVSRYMAEVRKYPLLTKEQEIEISRKYFETKDPKLAQILVTSNLRFVVKIAAEYSKFGARLIDLIQEGNMGLMHGVKDFNPYKGVRLITYAVWWIRGYIQEYLMKQYSLVKIGTTANQKKLFYQLQRQKQNLEQIADGSKAKQISEELGIPEEEVQIMAQRLSGRDLSLNQTMDDDGGTSFLDFQKGSGISPDEALSRKEELEKLRTRIEELRPELSERELILLEERILADDPLTLQEIGEKYKITREAVRQAEVRLLNKIKAKFSS